MAFTATQLQAMSCNALQQRCEELYLYHNRQWAVLKRPGWLDSAEAEGNRRDRDALWNEGRRRGCWWTRSTWHRPFSERFYCTERACLPRDFETLGVFQGLQRVVNKVIATRKLPIVPLEVDGKIGPMTLAATQQVTALAAATSTDPRRDLYRVFTINADDSVSLNEFAAINYVEDLASTADQYMHTFADVFGVRLDQSVVPVWEMAVSPVGALLHAAFKLKTGK